MLNPENIWNRTELMKILGCQTIDFYFDKDVLEVKKTFFDTFGNKTMLHIEKLMFAMYQLGKIHGIRQERKKRKLQNTYCNK